ncbi:MAG: glycosyltransferase [Pseudomonadota bacterium]
MTTPAEPPVRILHIAHQQLRRYGATRVSWARKLDLGLIKAGFDLHNFSDRDVAAFEAPFGIRYLGERKAQQRLLEMTEAVEPDLVIVGHCDSISNATLAALRQLRPEVHMVHCNNDPLFVPSNAARIEHRAEVCDRIIVSTGRRTLNQVFPALRGRLFHMPNPVDASIERFDSSLRTDLDTDLIFCSKSANHTNRLSLVDELRPKLPADLRFRTPGANGVPGVWGLDYDRALADSRMGLNINRQEGDYWYSSARMAQLGGNGLLVFTHADNGFQDLFPPESIVYFHAAEDLAAQIAEFHSDDDRRRARAARTRRFFHEELSSERYARYIVETATERPLSERYAWLEDN